MSEEKHGEEIVKDYELRIKELTEENERANSRAAKALIDFAQSIKKYYSSLPGKTIGSAVKYYIDEKLKEALDSL